MITAIGFVQVDSICTVARAQHMILFSRNQNYRVNQLTHLLEKDRTLFEHWTHDAAVIPTVFYPYWRHRFKREQTSLISLWQNRRRDGFEKVLSDVFEYVALNGPTMARDLGSKSKSGTGWWDWHPEKTALEFHWRTGRLAITGRNGFQKIYDLSKNVIPEIHRAAEVSEEEFINWACFSALNRLGIATSREISAFWDLATPEEVAIWCQGQLGKGNLIDIQIEPFGDGREL